MFPGFVLEQVLFQIQVLLGSSHRVGAGHTSRALENKIMQQAYTGPIPPSQKLSWMKTTRTWYLNWNPFEFFLDTLEMHSS